MGGDAYLVHLFVIDKYDATYEFYLTNSITAVPLGSMNVEFSMYYYSITTSLLYFFWIELIKGLRLACSWSAVFKTFRLEKAANCGGTLAVTNNDFTKGLLFPRCGEGSIVFGKALAVTICSRHTRNIDFSNDLVNGVIEAHYDLLRDLDVSARRYLGDDGHLFNAPTHWRTGNFLDETL